MLSRFTKSIGFFGFVALLFGACGPDGPNDVVVKDLENLTLDEQIMFGEVLVEEMRSNPSTYNILNGNAYSEIYTYLNDLLTTVVVTEQILLRNTFDWEIIPLEDESVYSYTMPGGKLVISTGFLKFFQSEAELVSLIAHELYYTDNNLLTDPMIDEFDGVDLGDVILGKGVNIPVIDYLKHHTFTQAEVMAADLHTLDLLCPFNYDISSLTSLINRATNEMHEDSWIDNRPRMDEWSVSFQEATAQCATPDGDTYRSRYIEMMAQLP